MCFYTLIAANTNDDDDKLVNLYCAITLKKRLKCALQEKVAKKGCLYLTLKCCGTVYKSAGKLFHAAGPAMANAYSPYRVFDVHFSSTSLPAVDAEVKIDMDNDHKIIKTYRFGWPGYTTAICRPSQSRLTL